MLQIYRHYQPEKITSHRNFSTSFFSILKYRKKNFQKYRELIFFAKKMRLQQTLKFKMRVSPNIRALKMWEMRTFFPKKIKEFPHLYHPLNIFFLSLLRSFKFISGHWECSGFDVIFISIMHNYPLIINIK